jgi:hypothetical protein
LKYPYQYSDFLHIKELLPDENLKDRVCLATWMHSIKEAKYPYLYSDFLHIKELAPDETLKRQVLSINLRCTAIKEAK